MIHLSSSRDLFIVLWLVAVGGQSIAIQDHGIQHSHKHHSPFCVSSLLSVKNGDNGECFRLHNESRRRRVWFALKKTSRVPRESFTPNPTISNLERNRKEGFQLIQHPNPFYLDVRVLQIPHVD